MNDTSQLPAAEMHRGKVRFARNNNSFYYSDGSTWNQLLASSVSFTTPTISYASASADGTATTALRSDVTFKFPQALGDTGALHSLTLSDTAGVATLTNSDAQLRVFSPTGVRFDSTTAAGGNAAVTVGIDATKVNGGVISAMTSSNPTTTPFYAWRGDLAFIGAAVTNNIVVSPFLTNTFTWGTSAGSSATGLQAYGAIFTGLQNLGAANGSTFSDVGGLWVKATTKNPVGTPTCTTGYGARIEFPQIGSTDQIGVNVADSGAGSSVPPTNSYGVKTGALIRGTNRTGVSIVGATTGTPTLTIGLDIAAQGVGTTKYSIRTATDAEYFGGHVQMDDSVKVRVGTAQDAEIYYDGTDLILDPDVVGTGVVRHAGKTALDDDTTIADAKNIILNTSNGTKIGTATSQKLGFWNKAPVIQPATTGTASSMVAGGGAAVDDKATFTGGTGATAYRIDDIVNNLKTCGILAA